jgi:hypothetical protein
MLARKSTLPPWIKKHRISLIAGSIVLFLILVLRLNFVTTLAIAAGAGILQYFSSKYQMRIDTGHVFFLGIMLARVADGMTAGLFVLIIGIVPKMMGGDIDPVILAAYVIQAIFVFISSFFAYPIVIFGIILTVLTFAAVFFMTIAIDFDVAEIIDDTIIPGVINIVLFLVAGEFFYSLLSALYS